MIEARIDACVDVHAGWEDGPEGTLSTANDEQVQDPHTRGGPGEKLHPSLGRSGQAAGKLKAREEGAQSQIRDTQERCWVSC